MNLLETQKNAISIGRFDDQPDKYTKSVVRSIKVTLLTLETRQLFGWSLAFVTSIYKLFN